jgi:hypothetical protein
MYGDEQHQVIPVCRDNVRKSKKGLQLPGDHEPATVVERTRTEKAASPRPNKESKSKFII